MVQQQLLDMLLDMLPPELKIWLAERSPTCLKMLGNWQTTICGLESLCVILVVVARTRDRGQETQDG